MILNFLFSQVISNKEHNFSSGKGVVLSVVLSVAVRTGGLESYFRLLFRKYIFNVTKQAAYLSLLLWRCIDELLWFGSPHRAGDKKEDKDAQENFNKAELTLVKDFTDPGSCNVS